LWVFLAFLVWNVVFDRVIVVAGRQYVAAATLSAARGIYTPADGWMRAAAVRGAGLATVLAAAVLGVGVTAIAVASRRSRAAPSEVPCEP
jgi:hypothetical protein